MTTKEKASVDEFKVEQSHTSDVGVIVTNDPTALQ